MYPVVLHTCSTCTCSRARIDRRETASQSSGACPVSQSSGACPVSQSFAAMPVSLQALAGVAPRARLHGILAPAYDVDIHLLLKTSFLPSSVPINNDHGFRSKLWVARCAHFRLLGAVSQLPHSPTACLTRGDPGWLPFAAR